MELREKMRKCAVWLLALDNLWENVGGKKREKEEMNRTADYYLRKAER